ncbi:MAG: hypothetical protein FD146_1049 [Anaerolineaceae bacterium]|nr:MAG: hypothetical protein FD146_1049 [Anaerolineaceae bacterium]
MTTPEQTSVSPDTSPVGLPSRMRIRFGLTLTIFGLFLFLLGARPGLFGLDRSPVVGFVQISVFLIGLAVICVGGYICLTAFWKNGSRTIAADIGSRLVATGYVIVVFAGMADVFGMGTQGTPKIPFFGPWQAVGVQVGEAVIALGFLLLIPYRKLKARQPEEGTAQV